MKTGSLLAPVLLLLVVFSFVALPACSTMKAVWKPKQTSAAFDTSLVGQGGDDVKKKLGEPTDISKTTEGHILWVYRPSWKIMPDDKGTRYVEFEDGKVTKVFNK